MGLKKLLLLISILTLTVNIPCYAGFFKKIHKFKTNTQVPNTQNIDFKKIYVVEIFASWCPGCKNIQPVLDQLIKDEENINFIQLDVSTPSKAKLAETKSLELNIKDFYEVNKSKTSTVGIIIPNNSQIIKIFQNNTELEEYKSAIEEAKTKQKALESL